MTKLMPYVFLNLILLNSFMNMPETRERNFRMKHAAIKQLPTFAGVNYICYSPINQSIRWSRATISIDFQSRTFGYFFQDWEI